MTHAESTRLIAILAAAFPNSRFTSENATVYEGAIADLEARETQAAVEELIRASAHLPPVAAIRAEVMRGRRDRTAAEDQARLRITDASGRSAGPAPHVWGATLSRMLEEAARARARDAAWRKANGLEPRDYVDPGQRFIDMASEGARGRDVSELAAREGWGT